MTATTNRGSILLTAFVAIVASGIGARPAQAQWGMGGGMGWGLGFGGAVEQPGTFLNSVALSQMNHVRGPMQNNVYAGNPNAYINHVRDNGFVDRYNVRQQQLAYNRSMSQAQGRGLTPTSATVPNAKPIVPLTSFYNAQNQLVWAGDAPTAGDLKEKRDSFDQASQIVLDEAKKNGVASIASVTEARQKLLDYGRPGLKYVRAHETARVADSFHGFLLELYDSLAQAANPPTATAAARGPGSPPSS